MAFTFDSNLRVGINAANPRVVSYTVGASATVLIVSLLTSGATQRAGGAPTFNGVTMTQASITQQHTGDAVSLEVWYLLNPANGGTFSLSIPNTNVATIDGFIVSYNNTTVGNVVALDSAVSTNGSSTNPAISLTTATANELIFGCLYEITTVAPSASTFTSFNYNDTTFEHCNQYGIRASASTANLSWTNSTTSNFGLVAVAFQEVAPSGGVPWQFDDNTNIQFSDSSTVYTDSLTWTFAGIGGAAIGGIAPLAYKFIGSGGSVEGGTATNYPIGGVLLGDNSAGGYDLTDFIQFYMCMGGTNTLLITSSTSSGVTIGGTTTLALTSKVSSGVLLGGTTPILITSSVSRGSVVSGSTITNIGSATTNGVTVSGTTTPTQTSYGFIAVGGMIAGGNYKLNFFPVGGTVIRGAALGSYMIGGVLLGGNAAVSYNTMFTPSGGTVESGTHFLAISFLSDSGMIIGGSNTLSLSVLTDSGVVTSNSDLNLTLSFNSTGGTATGGTGFNFLYIPDGGVICAGSIASSYVINPEGGVVFDSEPLETISFDPTTETDGLVINGSGINTNELVDGGSVLGGENTVLVGLTPDGGSVCSGHYTAYYETDPDGGLVVETVNNNLLGLNVDGGIIVGGFYTATYLVSSIGGCVLSGNYQYQVIPVGGTATNGTAFPERIKVTPFGGVALGGTNTEKITNKVSGGCIAGGHYFNASFIDFLPVGGTVSGGASTTALKVPVAGGMVVGGTLPLSLRVNTSGGILSGGSSIVAININELSEGGTATGGFAFIVYPVLATGGFVLGGDTSNTIEIVNLEDGGLVVASETLISFAFDTDGGCITSGEAVSVIDSLTSGGVAIEGEALYLINLQNAIDLSTGLVLGGTTTFIYSIYMNGGVVVNVGESLLGITIPTDGGLLGSNNSILEAIHYSYTGQGGLITADISMIKVKSAVSGGMLNSNESILQLITIAPKAGVVLSGVNTLGISSITSLGFVSNGTALSYPLGGIVTGGVGHTEELDLTIGIVFGGVNVQSYQFIAKGGIVVSNNTPIMHGGLVLGGTYTRATVTSGGLLVGGSNQIQITLNPTEGIIFGGAYYVNVSYSPNGGIVVSNLHQGGMVLQSVNSYKILIHSSGGLVTGGHHLTKIKKITTVIKIQSTSVGFRMGKK